MRVLFNASQAGNRSGTGTYTERLAAALVELGHDLVLAWPTGTPRPQGNAEYIAAPRGPLRRIAFDQWGVQRRARGLRADLIHYPASVGPLTGRARCVLTVHDLSFLVNPAWFAPSRRYYLRALVSASARRADRIIAVSQATAHDLVTYLGIDPARIHVVHEGVEPRFRPADPADIARVRARYRLPERYLLFMGTIEPRKNLVRLVQAYERAARDLPCDLVIAGRNGWLYAPILDAIRRSPAAARIHLPGFIDPADQPALLTAAEGFAFPSLYEGFGLPVLEAMACGAPVLTSTGSSLPEISGDVALLVDPSDTDALADGLRRLIHTPIPPAPLIAHAAQFTWARAAQQTWEVYEHASSDTETG